MTIWRHITLAGEQQAPLHQHVHQERRGNLVLDDRTVLHLSVKGSDYIPRTLPAKGECRLGQITRVSEEIALVPTSHLHELAGVLCLPDTLLILLRFCAVRDLLKSLRKRRALLFHLLGRTPT